jgi:hypothetical protein
MKFIRLILVLLLCPSVAFAGSGIKCGSTSKKLTIAFHKTADNTETTGLTNTGISCSWFQAGGAISTVTDSALALVTTAYTSGGMIEMSSTSAPGLYRFDAPDTMWACGGGDLVTLDCSGTASFHYQETWPLTLTSLDTLTAADGVSQAGAAGSINLASTASSVNGFYASATSGSEHAIEVCITTGASAGECRCGYDYTGSTRQLAIRPNWTTAAPTTDIGAQSYILRDSPDCGLAGAGGSGSSWTDSEKQNIRYALGVTGTKAATAGGIIDTLATNVSAVKTDVETSGVVLANGAITSAKIATDAIGASAIAAGAIGSSEIADGAVTAAKIAASAIGSAQVADGFITAAKLAADSIGASQLAANAIGSAEIADGAFTAAKFATGAFTVSTFATGAFDTLTVTGNLLNRLADVVWRRGNAAIEASTWGDVVIKQSPYGMVAKQTNKLQVSGGNLICKKADNSTTFYTQPITSDASASPIIGLD